jgi:hypothetical protein
MPRKGNGGFGREPRDPESGALCGFPSDGKARPLFFATGRSD